MDAVVAGVVALVLGIIVGRVSKRARAQAVEPLPPADTPVEAEVPADEAPPAEPDEEEEEDPRFAQLERLELRIAEATADNARLEDHLRALKRFADTQFRRLTEEIDELWGSSGLARRVHQLQQPPENGAWEHLKTQAAKAEEWMEELGVGSAELSHLLGLVHTLDGNREKAAERFTEATRRGMGVEAWLALGDTQWALDRREKARGSYENCLGRDDMPDHLFYRYAQVAVAGRQYREALQALERILDHRNADEEVFALASLAAGKLDDDARAVEICEAGLRRHPGSVRLMADMIIPLSRLGETEKADEIYRQASELEGEHAEVPFAMGVAKMQAGDAGDATELFEQALMIRDDYPEALCCLGILANKDGRFKAALRRFEAAVELRPEYAEAWYHMKDTYEGLRDYDNAMEALKEATRLNPEYR